MRPRFTRRFRIRHGELDALGHVHNVACALYLQEAAIEASTHLGFSPAWYQAHGVGWVVRRLSVRFDQRIGYGDEVEVFTWISQMRGVRCNREYDLVRVSDGSRLARGRAEWIYVDTRTGYPTRFPDEWLESFAPVGVVEELGIHLQDPRPTEEAYRYRSRRRVQFHELDTAQHVNHAVYLQWIEQAHCEALRAAGHPLEQTRREGWLLLPVGHEIHYVLPVRDHEPVEVVSWVGEWSEAGLGWTHEVHHAETGKLMARGYLAAAFVDLEGRPSALRPQVVADLLRGPALQND